jgi:hypothetical protein
LDIHIPEIVPAPQCPLSGLAQPTCLGGFGSSEVVKKKAFSLEPDKRSDTVYRPKKKHAAFSSPKSGRAQNFGVLEMTSSLNNISIIVKFNPNINIV